MKLSIGDKIRYNGVILLTTEIQVNNPTGVIQEINSKIKKCFVRFDNYSRSNWLPSEHLIKLN